MTWPHLLMILLTVGYLLNTVLTIRLENLVARHQTRRQECSCRNAPIVTVTGAETLDDAYEISSDQIEAALHEAGIDNLATCADEGPQR